MPNHHACQWMGLGDTSIPQSSTHNLCFLRSLQISVLAPNKGYICMVQLVSLDDRGMVKDTQAFAFRQRLA